MKGYCRFQLFMPLILCFVLTQSAFAQTRSISGSVLDSESNEPLIGATILVKGTTNGTVTDFDGNYTLDVTTGDVLIVSFTGYTSKEVEVGETDQVNVLLDQGIQIEEIVVTGYAVETKRQTTGAVATVRAKELAAIPSGNVEQQLQGRVTGVTVVTNGQPGTTSQIRVRGYGAFSGNEPLYVVDGVPVESTNFLNPDDIETTTVLKDAASASIYGARAANGVIVFTTKQGNRENRKMKVSYNGMIGFTDPNVAGSPEMLNPMDMAIWTHRAYENNAKANGEQPQYTHQQYGDQPTPRLPDYLHANGEDGVVGSIDLAAIQAEYEANPENVFLIKPNIEGTNWYDAITRTAPIHRHSLGFSGGTENGRYYIGLGMQEQSGILIANEFSRYSFRANSEWDLVPWLSIGQNLQFTYRSVRGQQGGGGGLGVADDESEVLSAYRMPTIIPVFDEFGSYASTRAAGFNNPRNPVRRLERNNGSDKGYNANGFGNFYILLKPIDGLTLRTSIGGQYNNFNFVNYGFRYLGDSEPEASNTFSEGGGYVLQWVFTNTASYTKQFGDHGITALAGLESLNTGAGRFFSGSGINPFSTDLDFQNLSTVQSPQVGSNLFSGVNFYSIFGKLDYNYQEKYYLTGVLRRDGSSRFGSNNRFGTFPAVSAAWRVTSEPFFQNISWLNDFKIRGGWGEMGNSNNVDPSNQFSLYNSNRARTFYPIQGQASGVDEGFAQSRIGNSDAKWETSESLNIGFDASFFNNRLEVILDWWKIDTRDLLFEVPLPGVTGDYAEAPAVNVASMLNKGLDFQIITRGNLTDELTYEFTLNNSFLKNEITSLVEGIDFIANINPSFRGVQPIRNAVGQSLSSFFGYQVIGYFQDEADVNNSPDQDGAGVGRFKYADLNSVGEDGNVILGQPDGQITPADRTFLGSPVPDWTGGATINLGWRNFSFETLWAASRGNEIWHQTKWFTDFFGTFEGSAKGVAAFDSWTPEKGNSAGAPIWESASNLSTSGAANSWYVENGNYIRLQRLAFTYDFGESLLQRLGISQVTLGLSANNVWTITNYTGLDPVVGGDADTRFGIDVGNYPVTPSYIFNLSLGF